ncbi:hypothetical protein AAG570_014030 [Ranatra chinensis]|uniref:Peptidase M20 dimerisation domain-containing protein n=1 Tax=Ranatra chinensis TaxID=642074 RepID=A0ABD0YAZ6_9HEMI
MDALKLAEAKKEYLIKLRRHFHMNPELGWQEFKTSERIKNELDEQGIRWEQIGDTTGIVAYIDGPAGSKEVGLRADMDALPIKDEKKVPYASQNEGVMHACGHDGHMAILLGTASILMSIRDRLKVGVRLIFQPAEEVIEGGAVISCSKAAQGLSNIGALHLWSLLETGTISVEPGPRMASADSFEITIKGKSAHASTPNLGVDALYIASVVENALQAIVSRQCDPLEPVVVTVGKLHSGNAYNILAGEAVMTGTVRTFNNDLRDKIPQMMEHIVKHITLAFNADYTYKYTYGTPPVINEPKSAAAGRLAAAETVGEKNIAHMKPIMGGEDFAYFLQKIPGMFAFIGCGKPGGKECYPHHHECFDINEESLVYAAAFLTNYVLKIQETLT